MSMLEAEQSDDERLSDLLKELVNVGGGRALSSLSQLLFGAALRPSVPDISVGDAAVRQALGGVRDGLWVVSLGVGDGLPGTFVLLFETTAAKAFAASMTRGAGAASPSQSTHLGPLERSALMELGNILACAFAEAVGSLLHKTVVPSTPSLEHVRGGPALAQQLAQLGEPVLVQTHFTGSSPELRGQIAMLWDRTAARELGRWMQQGAAADRRG